LDGLTREVAAIAADGEAEFTREIEGAEILLVDFEVVDGEVVLLASLDAGVGDAVFDPWTAF
jgi:hypothetical protein